MYPADPSNGLLNPSVQLAVTDSLLNVGPIKGCTMGQPGYLSEEVRTYVEAEQEGERGLSLSAVNTV